MVNGIPIFRVELAEGLIDAQNNAERTFGYCIEANKGPINKPTFIASNKEAINKFGIDFAPHFYQNPTGLVIVRVGFEGAKAGQIEYKAKFTENETEVQKTVLTIKAKSPGPMQKLKRH